MKKCFEENDLDCDFQKYNELDITPLDMQRSKEEHKRAIFLPASELASKAAKKLSCGEKKIELILLQDKLFFDPFLKGINCLKNFLESEENFLVAMYNP